MTTWVDRMKSRMKELGLTQEMVARQMGVSRVAISHYLSERSVPPLKQFEKIARILETDLPWLYHGSPLDGALSLKDKTSLEDSIPTSTHLPIPVLEWDQVGQVRNGMIPQDKINEWVVDFYINKKPCYALHIYTDSMISPSGFIKSIYPGDIIIINPTATPYPGQNVVAMLPGAKEAIFRQYVVEGDVHYLKTLDPQFPIIEIKDTSCIYGVLIYCISPRLDAN